MSNDLITRLYISYVLIGVLFIGFCINCIKTRSVRKIRYGIVSKTIEDSDMEIAMEEAQAMNT